MIDIKHTKIQVVKHGPENSVVTFTGPGDEVEIFPWKNGCHIISNLVNDLLIVQ